MIKIIFFFFFNDTATTEIYTLSLHDALPISDRLVVRGALDLQRNGIEDRGERPDRQRDPRHARTARTGPRSEEHTSELQSPCNLVCRLLLEKNKELIAVKLVARNVRQEAELR